MKRRNLSLMIATTLSLFASTTYAASPTTSGPMQPPNQETHGADRMPRHLQGGANQDAQGSSERPGFGGNHPTRLDSGVAKARMERFKERRQAQQLKHEEHREHRQEERQTQGPMQNNAAGKRPGSAVGQQGGSHQGPGAQSGGHRGH
ncbi:MAG: hypothetical protein KBD23_05165 [Gammaproteobacteria bacterium]|nr:hypothetical protein [Gammaproteobacteria bacterium]